MDTGAFDTGYGHFNVADSPALQKILVGLRDMDWTLPDQGAVRPGLIAGAISRVEQAVQVVLSPAL